MRRKFLVLVAVALLGLVCVLGVVSGGSAATPTAISWGKAVEVPGLATINTGGNANVLSVSCAAVGDCAAGGYYADGSFNSGNSQAFVVSETSGRWGDAVEVAGTLNIGDNARVNSVSCAAAGECAAGGYYEGSNGSYHAFVVSETSGSWGAAIEVPGTTSWARVNSISCVSVGACVAGGESGGEAFVLSETGGTWGNAVVVPGTAALNTGGNAAVVSISCSAAGGCAAGGYYHDGSNYERAFVVIEKKGLWGTRGVWGKAVVVRATKVNSVSCGASGNCVAGGYAGSGNSEAIVVSETNGFWGKAVRVARTLNTGHHAQVNAVSCSGAGGCAAGGFYSRATLQGFVVSETKGTWGNVVRVPGAATLNSGRNAFVHSISCWSAGDCAAGGQYGAGSDHSHVFVVSETNGSWGKAVEVPGTAALSVGGSAGLNSISCSAARYCAAGGYYDGDNLGQVQAFVVNTNNATSSCVVPNLVGKTLGAAKRTLKAAHCGVGKITTLRSRMKRGHVVAQRPRPGKHLKPGSKVALALSKGKNE